MYILTTLRCDLYRSLPIIMHFCTHVHIHCILSHAYDILDVPHVAIQDLNSFFHTIFILSWLSRAEIEVFGRQNVCIASLTKRTLHAQLDVAICMAIHFSFKHKRIERQH